MRITAEAKAETRQRIIDVATRLFATDGWEKTTTRSIAAEAGIASGTLFNYFESKEAVIAALMSEALDEAQQELRKRDLAAESVEEELFALIWAELRSLKRFRSFLSAAADTVFSPTRHSGPGESIRANHLAAVEQIVASNGIAAPLPALTLQLYWTLYVGVFAYWTTDDSPKQEDTLALLDQSLKLFVASLRQGRKGKQRHEQQPEGPHRRVAKRSGRRPSR
jgi:AcrR family transcriptional regulator